MLGTNKHLDINKISEITTVILFCLFVLSLPFSESFISITSGLILLGQIILLFFTGKIRSGLFSDISIWLIVSIFFVYIFGMFFSKDINLGFYELKKVVFWLILTLGVAGSGKVSKKNFWLILSVFVFGVTISTFFSFYKMMFSNLYDINNFREVNYVSHIPFSFQISFSILILVFSFFYENDYLKFVKPIFRILCIIWLIFFLFLLKSFLGIISFYVTTAVLTVLIINYISSRKVKAIILSIAIPVFIIPLIFITIAVTNFYNVKYTEKPAEGIKTKYGNEYVFDFSKKFKENGYYVSWYLCESELESSWDKRSKLKYNQIDKNGYLVSETLKRYLTSKGLKKDAEGIESLSERDILNIESGIANYIFDCSAYSIYPRVYETIWEIDHYLLTKDPNDQSLSQRIEYSKAALNIIKNNFWFGVGTGNFEEEYKKSFQEINSLLNENNYGSAHNQYLNYLLKFGIIGFSYILFVILFVVFRKGQSRNKLLILFLVYMMIANFGDSNLETHVGLSFFVFFYSFLIWHSPKNLFNKPDLSDKIIE